MIKGVVFDLDGLMIDSEPLALEAWQISLAPFGARLSDAQYRYLIGVSHDTSLRYIADHASIGIPVDEFAAIYHGNLMSLIDSDRLQPMPGLLPLLDAFAARGYALGIASNSSAEHVRRATARIGITARFGCMVSAEEVTHGKPAPDVYLEAARQLGLAPACCLAFEDSPSGVQAAQAADMYCVFVPNPDLDMTSLDGVEDVHPSLIACYAALDGIVQRASRRNGCV